MAAGFLLHHAADMCIGGVCCQGKLGLRTRVFQWNRGDEEAFDLFKSLRRRRGPDQLFWVAPQEICERFENPCAFWHKAAVKVYHAKKPLQLLDILRGGTLFDCGGLVRRWGGPSRRNHVA